MHPNIKLIAGFSPTIFPLKFGVLQSIKYNEVANSTQLSTTVVSVTHSNCHSLSGIPPSTCIITCYITSLVETAFSNQSIQILDELAPCKRIQEQYQCLRRPALIVPHFLCAIFYSAVHILRLDSINRMMNGECWNGQNVCRNHRGMIKILYSHLPRRYEKKYLPGLLAQFNPDTSIAAVPCIIFCIYNYVHSFFTFTVHH